MAPAHNGAKKADRVHGRNAGNGKANAFYGSIEAIATVMLPASLVMGESNGIHEAPAKLTQMPPASLGPFSN